MFVVVAAIFESSLLLNINIFHAVGAGSALGLLVTTIAFAYVQFTRSDAYKGKLVGSLSFSISFGLLIIALAIGPK